MKLNLSKVQQEIVNHDEGPLLVVAGPGSGKTRVLTERIRRLLLEKKGNFRILAITFTNKAANEMMERLSDIPQIKQRVFIGTIHSFCLEVLSNRGKHIGISEMPHIFESYNDRKQVLINAIVEYPEIINFLKNLSERDQNKIFDSWLTIIKNAKNNLLLPEMVDDRISSLVYDAYNNGLKSSNAIDFEDILFLTYRLFIEVPKIADFYRRQYKYICIDEAQDLNEAQYQLICALCSNDFNNIMMVGDPRQAIFQFNGAKPKYMEMFEQEFNAKTISMNENYRSSQAIVNAAKLLDNSYTLTEELPIKGKIELLEAENEKHEAQLVVQKILKLLKEGDNDVEEVKLEKIAILGRTRYTLSQVEEELKIQNIRYNKQLTLYHESESNLIRDFELCLRILSNPQDKIHLGMLLKRWKINDNYFKNVNLSTGLDILNALKIRITTQNGKTVINAIEVMDYDKQDIKLNKSLDFLYTYANQHIHDEDERALILNDISIWKNYWDMYLRSKPGGKKNLTSFLSYIALGMSQLPRQEGISLLTVHSSKSLEFDIVFIVGMTQGTFPDYRAKGEALEEERKNAFVAISRSKRLLYLSYPKVKKMPWGDDRLQEPSIYLKIIGLV